MYVASSFHPLPVFLFLLFVLLSSKWEEVEKEVPLLPPPPLTISMGQGGLAHHSSHYIWKEALKVNFQSWSQDLPYLTLGLKYPRFEILEDPQNPEIQVTIVILYSQWHY